MGSNYPTGASSEIWRNERVLAAVTRAPYGIDGEYLAEENENGHRQKYGCLS